MSGFEDAACPRASSTGLFMYPSSAVATGLEVGVGQVEGGDDDGGDQRGSHIPQILSRLKMDGGCPGPRPMDVYLLNRLKSTVDKNGDTS